MGTHYLEILACTAALFNIYLVSKSSMWNWLFGIIAVSLYMFIFFSAKLYADASLQIVFLLFQFYGIYQWLYGGKSGEALSIQLASRAIYGAALISFTFLFVLISFLLKNYTDSTTVYADAAITTLSLIAQWMMSKKYLQHWILWIVVDIGSIILYTQKSLYLTALVYFVFLLICIKGYLSWNCEMPQRLMRASLI